VKPALHAVLVVAVFGVAAFLLASLGSFWLTVRPPRLAIPLHPDEYRLPVERVDIRADDGVQLAAWFVPRPGAPTLILLHGYPAEKSDLLPLAAALAPSFTTLLVDLRYFGESGGEVTTLGYRERQDLKRAIDFVESRGATRVGVFGLSLGGAVALLTAAEDPRIRAVGAQASFADLRLLGQDLYAWMSLARYPFVEAMLLWSRVFLGVDISRPAPADAAARLTVPVLLIHSRQDEQVSFRHAERLRAALAANPRAEFEFTDRGDHGARPRGFEARLAAFFRRALAGQ